MAKRLLFYLFLLTSFLSYGQSLRLTGNVNDTMAKQGLPNTILMALKFSDSSLVAYSRSDKMGMFKSIKIPLDTYLVVLSHPNFSDKTYLLAPSSRDTAFNFKNIVLPPKSVTLNEVEIIAGKDKTYYKGDTLIFTADSFKTRPNASVEDLLKKLPGVSVDAKGKITVQGKEVDQVLVDGDEFFGGDPTVATRNLNATAVENIQVYDKKNESTEEGKSETQKVVNLQLKDDAKKGYFGKVSGASDFNRFYEGELLFNKFKGTRKASVFGLAANTPKQAFNWRDIDKYGLTGEQNWSYDEDSESWTGMSEEKAGVPQTIKSGFYFGDKFGKKTKLNMDYTFNQNQLSVGKQTNTQFFRTDTNYTNATSYTTVSQNQGQAFNFKLTHKLDSLTELFIVPKLRYSTSSNKNTQRDLFISENLDTTRSTQIINKNSSSGSNMDVLFKLKRNFKKKDRLLTLIYQPTYEDNESNSNLNTNYTFFKNQEKNLNTAQRKRQAHYKMEHNASAIWLEPLSKKIKIELSHSFSQNHNNTTRSSYDVSTGSDIFIDSLSNSFNNTRLVNRSGAKFIYDVKKFRVALGSSFRNIYQENTNLSTNKKLVLNANNVLPSASFVYRISQGSNLNFQYSTSSQQPDVTQMQPVIDNSDPNRLSVGNPNLKPTFSHNGNLNYYFYKGISDVNFYGGLNFGTTNKQISYTTTFDEQGRALTMPVNVDGNYYGNLYLGGGRPLFKRFMKLYYSLNANHNNNVSIVNGVNTISQSSGLNPSIDLQKQHEKFDAGLNANYSYNVTKTNVSALSTQPYYTYGFGGNALIRFPKKFHITVDGKYTNNGNRTAGYNLNYFILNAAIFKTFLKNENLITSIEANDILNQNIDNQRYISSNQIVDTKTTIIKRYFLLKVVFKINSQKTKEEGDDE